MSHEKGIEAATAEEVKWRSAQPGEPRHPMRGELRDSPKAESDYSRRRVRAIIAAYLAEAGNSTLIERERAMEAFQACPNCHGVGWTVHGVPPDGEAEQVQCECSAILSAIQALPAAQPTSACDVEFEEALEMFQQWATAYGQDISTREIDAQAEMHRAKVKLRYAFYRAFHAQPTSEPTKGGRWWCKRCNRAVEPMHVTFHEIHDPRFDGCGAAMVWQAAQNEPTSEGEEREAFDSWFNAWFQTHGTHPTWFDCWQARSSQEGGK